MIAEGSYKNITFYFIHFDYQREFRGNIISRITEGRPEIVLEVFENATESYNIFCRYHTDGYYKGCNSSRTIPKPIEATWAQVGKDFVGIWIENGDEYFFKFSLPIKKN